MSKGQHLVLGVVDDPGDLVGVQARVDGVQHAARARDAVEELQVAVAIPGQRGHPLGECQLIGVERVGHAARAPCDVDPSAAVDIALNAARDDFGFTMVALSKVDQIGNQKRTNLH